MNKRRYDIDGIEVTVIKTPLNATFSQGYAMGGDYGGNVIRVDTQATRLGQRISLLHELLHHLCERSGVSKALTKKLEERICDELSSFLVAAGESAPQLFGEIFFGVEAK